MSKFITDIRNSLWFAPSIIVIAAIIMAVVAVELDAIVGDEALAKFPRLFGAGADGARELLSAIASSTITVAGVVFSITIVALSLTAAQYSPRVLRNFMADGTNQVVLGVFVGIYVYCLLVLRTVRGGEESFVPGISVVLALAFAVVGIGFLIFFIHHIALSLQVSQIGERISADTIGTIRGIYPDPVSAFFPARPARLDDRQWHCIPAHDTGYIQHVQEERLAALACETRCVIRMERAVGDFVIEGHSLFSISGPAASFERLAQKVGACFAINTYRDLRQDPAFGIQQLVDIALKALSPGVNDIGTARNMVHHLTAIISELAPRAIGEQPHIWRDGALVLVRRGATFESLADEAFGHMRRYALDKPQLVLELLAGFAEIASRASAPERRAVLAVHVRALEPALAQPDLTAEERSALQAAVVRALAGL